MNLQMSYHTVHTCMVVFLYEFYYGSSNNMNWKCFTTDVTDNGFSACLGGRRAHQVVLGNKMIIQCRFCLENSITLCAQYQYQLVDVFQEVERLRMSSDTLHRSKYSFMNPHVHNKISVCDGRFITFRAAKSLGQLLQVMALSVDRSHGSLRDACLSCDSQDLYSLQGLAMSNT